MNQTLIVISGLPKVIYGDYKNLVAFKIKGNPKFLFYCVNSKINEGFKYLEKQTRYNLNQENV